MRSALFIVLIATLAQAKPRVATEAPKPPPRWQSLPLPPAMPAANAHGAVTTNGADIYWASYGATTGEPVILLHGGLGNSDHWAFQLPALVDAKQRIIAIDSRGQGRSTRTSARVTYDSMAADVIAVMDKLELKRAAFVGWSDGGEIALKLAIKNPDRVSKLFVFGTNYNSEGSKPRGSQRSQTFAGYSQKCRADYQKLSKTPKAYDELVDWLLPVWRTPMGFTKEQLKGITAPAVVADGDHDEVIVLDQVKEMAKLIPNAKLVIFDDASHFALWQDPTSFNKAVVEFLK